MKRSGRFDNSLGDIFNKNFPKKVLFLSIFIKDLIETGEIEMLFTINKYLHNNISDYILSKNYDYDFRRLCLLRNHEIRASLAMLIL